MLFRDVIVYSALVIFVLYITYVNNMWGVSKGTKKAKADVRLERQKLAKKKRTLKILGFLVKFDDLIGFGVNTIREEDYKYKIDRLRWTIKSIERVPRPKELSGLFKLLQVGGTFLGIVLFLLTGSPLAGTPALLLFTPAFFHAVAINTIIGEDMQLERDFPDLYIVLYNRLVQGSNARISPVLKEFLISLDATRNNDKSKQAIRNFVMDLSNNIEIFGDDTIAIRELRGKYRSVVIINFINLAVQSLNGVNNNDKLLTFKTELTQKKVEYMKQRADKMVKRGSYAIWAIYLILAQFVVLSWLAKLSQAGTFGGFGLFK